MHTVHALVALALLAGGPAAPGAPLEIPLATRSLLGGAVEMLIPTGFQPMREALLKRKYPAERRPTVVLANESGSVSVALNHTRDRLSPAQLPDAHRALEQMFRRLYPSAVWFRSGLVDVNGRKGILLELRTPAIDTEIRNLMLATPVDDRALLVSVNMTKELEDEWLETANRILGSVTIRK